MRIDTCIATPPRSLSPWVLAGLVVLWTAGVGLGIWLLGSYANRPGPGGSMGPAWSSGGPLRLDAARPTLLVFLHPRCPCSRASVDELNKLLARAAVRPAVTAVFIRPPGFTPGWEREGLWSSAASIPGVELLADPEGTEARRFGVETSGHAMLFAPDGVRLFSGGITSARGHAGDSAGLSLILDRLKDASLPGASTPVFGCLLFAELSTEEQP